jgi:TusA-related sulfurtransferase
MSDDNDILKVDARGLECPEPLMRTKSALNKTGGKAVEVTVDTAASRDNILRMAGREGRTAAARAEGDAFVVRIEAKQA